MLVFVCKVFFFLCVLSFMQCCEQRLDISVNQAQLDEETTVGILSVVGNFKIQAKEITDDDVEWCAVSPYTCNLLQFTTFAICNFVYSDHEMFLFISFFFFICSGFKMVVFYVLSQKISHGILLAVIKK